MAGVQRMLQRPNENLPWSTIQGQDYQLYDQDSPENQRLNYFRLA